MPIQEPAPHPSSEPCRACGGELLRGLEATVLGDVPVLYGVCRQCRSLMLPEPTWLDRAYAQAITPDPDTGALQRSLMVWRVTRRLRALGLVPPGARSLDFGAGKGILLRAMLDDRLDAWGYDPYPQSTFAQERVLSVLPEGPFDLVTMIEVLEHTLDPVGVLRQLGQRLGPDGLMLVTTEFYREGQHGPGWAYLAPESGQHVTIFSAQGFTAAVKAAGLAWIGSLPWGGQPFVHIVARRGLLSGWKWLRLRLRHKRGEHRAKRPQFA